MWGVRNLVRAQEPPGGGETGQKKGENVSSAPDGKGERAEVPQAHGHLPACPRLSARGSVMRPRPRVPPAMHRGSALLPSPGRELAPLVSLARAAGLGPGGLRWDYI